jgi:hypothetical protein
MNKIFSKKETSAGRAENCDAIKELMMDEKVAKVLESSKSSKSEDLFKRIKGQEVTKEKMQGVLGEMMNERNRKLRKDQIRTLAKKCHIKDSEYIHYDPKRNLPKPAPNDMRSGFSRGKTTRILPATSSPAPTRYMGTLSH